MSLPQPLIEAENLRKIYSSGGHRLEAIRGVSLTLFQGDVVSVMGPSGCGKTTLLNCLAGLDEPDGGTVRIGDRDLYAMKPGERDLFRLESMGFLFQNYNLIPVLSALENVEVPLLCQNLPPKEARSRAIDALIRVGLQERAHHRPAELSGGQQQRVALARAIVNRPTIVWADEPTGALDSRTTDMVMDLIDHLNRIDGITFVIVTHNPEVAERSHRVLYMDSGTIAQYRHPGNKRNFVFPKEEG